MCKDSNTLRLTNHTTATEASFQSSASVFQSLPANWHHHSDTHLATELDIDLYRDISGQLLWDGQDEGNKTNYRPAPISNESSRNGQANGLLGGGRGIGIILCPEKWPHNFLFLQENSIVENVTAMSSVRHLAWSIEHNSFLSVQNKVYLLSCIYCSSISTVL